MELKQKIIPILREYLPVRSLNDNDKQVYKKLVEKDLTNVIRKIVGEQNFSIKGHTQVGNWADVPWIGIHYNDKNIDSAPKTGIYIAILLRIDGSGFAFSIQHGTDSINSINKIKNMVNEVSKEFKLPSSDFIKGEIILRPRSIDKKQFSNSSRPAKYEIANIVGKEYEADEIPDALEDDLIKLVKVYKDWATNIKNDDLEEDYQIIDSSIDNNIDEPNPPKRKDIMNIKAGSLHPPRSQKEGIIALSNANYKCEVDSDHETFYNDNNIIYMEKHHLIPMEHYFDYDKSIDHYLNIYSLCPNCHRKIHYAKSNDKIELIKFLYKKRQDLYMDFYSVYLEKVLSYYIRK